MTENTWLQNSFTGTDPDEIDLTFDDAENTIFNSNYKFKIGSDVYELRADGFYLNGVNQDGGLGEARTSSSVCKSNKKITSPPIQPSGTRRFILKASIHSIGLRSSIKSKVVHYKYKDGSWKKARARLAVSVRGAVRNTVLTPSKVGEKF